MTERKLLIVSTYFAPAARIGGRRAEKFAEAFLKQGWQVDVLSLDPVRNSPVDPTLKVPEGVGRFWAKPSFDPGRLAGLFKRVVWQSVEDKNPLARLLFRSWPLRALMRLAGGLGVISPFFPWEGPAMRALAGKRYDAVVATLPPSSAAVVGARHAAACGALLYVDYRDPWHDLNFYDAPSPLAAHFRQLNAKKEQACLEAARRVVAVSPTLGRWAEEKTDTPVYVLPHGYVAEPEMEPYPGRLELPDPADGAGLIVFYYVGALLYGRDLGPVFRLAKDIEDQQGRRCRVLYSGIHGDWARAQAERVGAADLLVDTGAIPHPQVNHLMRRVTANVVVISKGFEYQYPGKLWDAVAARRPILLMGDARSDSAQLVESHGLGVVLSSATNPAADVLARLQKSEGASAASDSIARMTTERLYAAFVEAVAEDVSQAERQDA
ncbi:MAG TPA: hypothetical protein VKN76_16175 [Kiloniellaceae bacterium]|nr:hypothetical protein [Kiloniellaceae bacterium]